MFHSLQRKTPTAKSLIKALALLAAFTANSSAADNIPALETVPVTIGKHAVERVFDGTVEAVQQATVSAQTAGRIQEVNFDIDDFVEAGSILIRFTDVEQQTDLLRAQAELTGALARAVETSENFARAESLKERGLGSQRDLDRAVAAKASAAANVSAAESAVVAAKQQLEYTVVRAPYSGIVTQRHIEVGETVSSGQPLISGLSLEKLRVTVDLPQQVAGQVRDEPRAVVLTETERVEPGKITLFSIADPTTNTFRVRLEMPNGQFGLFPGMFVKAAFQIGEAERLLIPAAALVQRSEVTAVYVSANGDVRLRQVRIGHAFGDQIEVLAGLTEGEQVAVDPVQAGIYAKSSASAQP